MKTCPNCGAENRNTASECRLCATPLIVAAASGESGRPAPAGGSSAAAPAPATPAASSSAPPPPSDSPASASVMFCPGCGAENEVGWAFCQGCGKKLDVEAAVPSVKEIPAPAEVLASPRPSKPDTGKVSRPPATKFDEPAPTPPSAPVEPVPTVREVAPVPGGPALRKPQADFKPAAEPVSAPKASAANSPQPPAAKVLQPAAGAPPVVNPVAANPPKAAPAEPQLSWKTVAACFECGAVIPPGAQFCAGCGKPIGSAAKKATGGAVIEVVTEGGKIGDVYPIFRGDLIIGRIEGDVTFPHDGYMSSRHARIMERDGRYYLSDESSRNGTFVRIRQEIELKPGDTFLVGKQVLKFDKK